MESLVYSFKSFLQEKAAETTQQNDEEKIKNLKARGTGRHATYMMILTNTALQGTHVYGHMYPWFAILGYLYLRINKILISQK
jgi:hypothetical protein